MCWGKEPVGWFHWVSIHANTLWLYDTNQSTKPRFPPSSKGQSVSSELQRSLNTVISNSVIDEMVKGSGGQGSNECRCECFIKVFGFTDRAVGPHLSELSSHDDTFVRIIFKVENEGYLLCKNTNQRSTLVQIMVEKCTLKFGWHVKTQLCVGAMAIPHGNYCNCDWSARAAHVFSYILPMLLEIADHEENMKRVEDSVIFSLSATLHESIFSHLAKPFQCKPSHRYSLSQHVRRVNLGSLISQDMSICCYGGAAAIYRVKSFAEL